jgi:large conductance mechanosensitive channel
VEEDHDMRGLWTEFKAFLLKSNALALAIGVIIGVALGAVVNSLVKDIIMPPIGYLLGGLDLSSFKIVLKDAVNGDPATEVAIRYGAFVLTVISFFIIALIVWIIARSWIKDPPPEDVKICPFCKEPNAPDAVKCKACTSEI